MALAICTISGTLYNADGTVAVGEYLRVVRCVLNGNLITNYLTKLGPSDANGNISFTLPQGATVWLFGNVVGFDLNEGDGVALVIPTTSTAALSSLPPPTSTPSTVPVAVPGGGFQFTQATPQTVWTITHGLNTRPMCVELYDLNWKKIAGDVDASTSANVIMVIFNVAQAGYARIV